MVLRVGAFGGGKRVGDARERILDRQIKRGPVRTVETVFHIPDLFGDRKHWQHSSGYRVKTRS